MTSNTAEQCTGFCDSTGTLIKFGNRVRIPTDDDSIHGSFAVYEITKKGTSTPFVRYLYSEKGQVLPVGMTGCPLTDLYDAKQLGKLDDVSALCPDDELLIIEEDMPT